MIQIISASPSIEALVYHIQAFDIRAYLGVNTESALTKSAHRFSGIIPALKSEKYHCTTLAVIGIEPTVKYNP